MHATGYFLCQHKRACKRSPTTSRLPAVPAVPAVPANAALGSLPLTPTPTSGNPSSLAPKSLSPLQARPAPGAQTSFSASTWVCRAPGFPNAGDLSAAASRARGPPFPRLPAATHIFRCRSNSAFFSSSSRFCFSSRLLRLLTVRPKMSMRSGGDEARSRSRSRRDTAVLVERERDRDSRRRFRLLSRDLERFRTRSLSRDRDRDRLRFLLCLLLLVCLERDELRLRDRPILPGDAQTNRWPRGPLALGSPCLRLRTLAGRLVAAERRKAALQPTFWLSSRATAATKAASHEKAEKAATQSP